MTYSYTQLAQYLRCPRSYGIDSHADFAVYNRHQHENVVAESLAGNGFEVFLPTYNMIRHWKDREKQLSMPLFPCYVFVRSNFERCFRVLRTGNRRFQRQASSAWVDNAARVISC